MAVPLAFAQAPPGTTPAARRSLQHSALNAPPAALRRAADSRARGATASGAAAPRRAAVAPPRRPRRCALMAAAAPAAAEAAPAGGPGGGGRTMICTSITAPTVDAFLAEIAEAQGTGVDVLELRLDFLTDFTPEAHLEALMAAAAPLPYIVTFRPTWEGGNYDGPEPERLATLKLAALRGAPYVDVEFKAAALFFAGAGEVPVSTQVILSSHNFKETPSLGWLHAQADAMRAAGADIVKIATMANDIADAAAVLSLLQVNKGPTIALAMGERGQITRLLAAKYGGVLTFAALSDARASAPGQPTIAQLRGLYGFGSQGPSTALYGIIGNPVHHSKSPLIHNTAFRQLGHDGVFVPLLVDDLPRFLSAFEGHDWAGFSVTIPHKEAAHAAAAAHDPVAGAIGAVNTLIRQPGGGFKGYNTDWVAAISVIERVLAAGRSGAASPTSREAAAAAGDCGARAASPLSGRTFLVVGAGGAGRALAFGAASRGATVLIANRSRARAEALAAAVPGGATVVDWGALQAGEVSADVLANSTSVGMVPDVEATPVATAAVGNFKVVFDAVYTPRETRLLRDAAAAGCLTADGVAMFVGQAVEQLKLFTGTDAPPVQLMEDAVLAAAVQRPDSSALAGMAEPPDGAPAAAPEQASPPLPYVLDADGRRQPLPGVRALFVRGGGRPPLGAVSRAALLADVQFQGAISDFHCVRDALKASDCDVLEVRAVPDDAYGDGSNYELALTRSAAEAWAAADAAAAAAEEAAAAAAPRSRRRREPRPWQDQGTEAELAATGIVASAGLGAGAAPDLSTAPRPPAAGLLLSRPRRAFGGRAAFVDVPASELWASNANEIAPFRDVTYDLRRATLDSGTQAVPRLREAAVQATGGRPRPGSTQTAPRELPAEEVDALLSSSGFATFLEAVRPRLDEVLLQNAVGDILADDLDQLADEEGEGLAGGGAGTGSGDTKAAGAGRAAHGGLIEAQSFTHLTYSKNKVVSAIAWLPHRRGVVACACTDAAGQTERLAGAGRLSPAYVLVWSFRDPIHPQYVLESPHEIFSFQHNPANPDLVVGGAYNGQLVLWDTAELAGPAARRGGAAGGADAGGAGSGRGGALWEDARDEEAATQVLRHKYLSAVEASHTSAVTDVAWLPGIEIDRGGKCFAIRASSAGTSAQALLRSSTLGAAAKAAAEAGSTVPRECCFFASIAADGKVLFWDARVDKLIKRGTKRADDATAVAELVWRPMHAVHLLSAAGNDFAGCRFTFDPRGLDSGTFAAGSLDGELLCGTFIRPVGDDNPDYTKSVFASHAGPLVTLAPSPFLPDLLLSVDDWSFRLWQGPDSREPVFTSPNADEAYTAAVWSPTRPGLLFLSTCGGSLHVWDLLDRNHEPSLRVSVSSVAIASLALTSPPPRHAAPPARGDGEPPPGGGEGGGGGGAHAARHPAAGGGLQVLAVGDAAGVLRLFELPRPLRRPLPNERHLMEGFVAREAARLADVAARQPLRAAALKRLEESKQAAEEGPGGAAPPDAAGARDAGVRESIASATGALAAPPARLTLGPALGGAHEGAGPRQRTSEAGVDRAAAVAAAADAARAERRYRELEAAFKEQLGLA
ncbi:bifunctional 3-dehydroquinate dehydratase/shikimate dehydrogenase [Scenedesmus sp. PABB004]|nr:bifunctional 3-dehydroquinate dehydratase/shikimate dehydrogenase [Scenedesmus sp. PABB004]